MKEIEITHPIELNIQQLAVVEMHSILNILNILVLELDYLSTLAKSEEYLRASINRVFNWAKGLKEKTPSKQEILALKIERGTLASEVQSLFNANPSLLDNAQIVQAQENILSVLDVLAVRLDELIERQNINESWVMHNIQNLQNKFMNTLAAIEKNSKGRYRILYNIAAQEVQDYYVDFKIESTLSPMIYMPPVFQDVMRDLIANARKYTDVGGRISAGIHQNAQELVCVVEDNGCGIPEHDLENVVNYGTRASNVAERRTMGGGFGLTKAYYLTRRFNGRFWIRSQENQGTRIRIKIPLPIQES